MDDRKPYQLGRSFRLPLTASLVLVFGPLFHAGALQAGGFIFAGDTYGTDLILHPTGYTGTGGQLELNVCIEPGTANEAAMEQSVRNIVAVYNQLLPTTGNLRTNFLGSGQLDFESVALHEVGHCLGKAHVNLASESGLSGADRDYTKSTVGSGSYDIAPGTDGVRGSSDDVRGDDVNLHWFRESNNNPFTIDYLTVDSTTYAVNAASLPTGHLFAANGDRTVGSDVLSTPKTEAVMQQGTYSREIQRTLTPDGVATLQYAMSGLDEIAGTSDDYTLHLNFIETTTGCDLKLQFSTGVGLAYCSVGGASVASGHFRITSANMYYGEEYTWFFNGTAPCSKSLALTQDQWTMFSLPCSVGISTGNTVADVLGDDMAGTYLANWVVFEQNAATNTYRRLKSDSEMYTGKGYWVFTDQPGQTMDVEGQYNGSPDTPLRGEAGGRPNLVGNPFDFSVDWADVQIVDGSDVQSLSDAVTDGDLSETYHIWNGNAYSAFDASTPGMIGTLNEFDAIWVKTYTDGIHLRVPSIVASGASPPAGDFNSMGANAAVKDAGGVEIADDGSWFVRLIVESGNYRDAGNVLGQLPDSVAGWDKHDLEELAPFGSSYLTIVFPHEEWGGDAWGYTSDFHATTRKPGGEWLFAVRASEEVSQASLRLEGPESVLRKAQLRDLETGKRIKLSEHGYTFDLNVGVRYFSFRVGKN